MASNGQRVPSIEALFALHGGDLAVLRGALLEREQALNQERDRANQERDHEAQNANDLRVLVGRLRYMFMLERNCTKDFLRFNKMYSRS
jgi:hypothetical protein